MVLNEVTLVDQHNNPFVPTAGSGSADSPYVFAGGPSSYVAQKLIDLWYAWADYYVQNVGATTVSQSGQTTGDKFTVGRECSGTLRSQ